MDTEHAELGRAHQDPKLHYVTAELFFEILYVEYQNKLLAFGADVRCQLDSRDFSRRPMSRGVRTGIYSTEGGPLFDIHRLHDFAGHGILPVEDGEEAQSDAG